MFPNNKNNMGLKKDVSKIHGIGIFTDTFISSNQPLFLAITLENEITTRARYLNHSNNSNCYMIYTMNLGWVIFSKHCIQSGDEITVDYNSAPYFIQPPDPSWI